MLALRKQDTMNTAAIMKVNVKKKKKRKKKSAIFVSVKLF